MLNNNFDQNIGYAFYHHQELLREADTARLVAAAHRQAGTTNKPAAPTGLRRTTLKLLAMFKRTAGATPQCCPAGAAAA